MYPRGLIPLLASVLLACGDDAPDMPGDGGIGDGGDGGDAPVAPEGFALLKDINVRHQAVGARNFVPFGGATLFITDDRVHGQRLYRTDGTAAGTSLIATFPSSSATVEKIDLRDSAVLGGQLYFSANDGVHGDEPWKTDGTATGTVRVAATSGAVSVSNASGYVAALGKLFFNADTNGFTRENLCSDGTLAGTFVLGVGNYGDFVELDGKVIFTASSPSFEIEPWITDGTAAGTHMLKNIGPGTAGSSARKYQRVGARVYFWADNGVTGLEPWVTDGTDAGTMLLKDINPSTSFSSQASVTQLVGVGNLALFAAVNSANGEELWATDGTPANTAMVKDIAIGTASGRPIRFVTMGGVAYFFAAGSTGTELWRSDGTAAGTSLVKDIYPGTTSAIGASNLVVHGGALYFVAIDGATGATLWRSDGTEGGTTMVVDLFPGGSSLPTELSSSNGKLYFTGSDGAADAAVFTSDGTAAGTTHLAELAAGATSDSVPAPTRSGSAITAQLGDKILFVADDKLAGAEPWITDGTAAGTSRLADIAPGATASMFIARTSTHPVVAGGRFFFVANDQTHGNELWTSDGTEAGTHMVRDINPAALPGVPNTFSLGPLPVGDLVYFIGIDAAGAELWKSDGTEAGTQRVIDLHPTGNGVSTTSSLLGRLCSFAGGVVVSGEDATGPAVFFIQGTTATRLTDYGTDMAECVGTSAALFFVAPGKGLYRSDGTLAGTARLVDLASASRVWGLTAVGDKVAFAGPGMTTGTRTLWASDGTAAGTAPVSNVFVEAPANIPPGTLNLGAVFQGRLYFSGSSSSSGGFALWRSDLTAAGTVAEMGASPSPSAPSDFLATDSGLYFAATDTTHGTELWRLDATETKLLGDLNAGAGASAPVPLGFTGQKMILTADNGFHGFEPWAYAMP